jgi:hypothetical protein
MRFAEATSAEGNVEVIGTDGRVLLARQINPGTSNLSISCAGLAPGTYVARTSNASVAFSTRFVKD